MTHQITVELTCDKCGAHNESWATTVAEMREIARKDGWAFSRNKDICCNCRERKPKGLDKETWLNLRPDLAKGEEQ